MRTSANTSDDLQSHLVSTHFTSSVHINQRTEQTGAHESAHDNFNWIIDGFIHGNHGFWLQSAATSL